KRSVIMLKPIGLAAAMLFAGLGIANAHGGHDEKSEAEEGKAVTMTGEVMDLGCYMQHPETGQGPEHAGCGKMCVNKGIPAGLKVDKRLYLLLAEGHVSVADLVAKLVGQKTTVQGKLIDRDGMSAIIVSKATRAP